MNGCRRIVGWIDVCTHERAGGRTDGGADGRTDVWIDGSFALTVSHSLAYLQEFSRKVVNWQTAEAQTGVLTITPVKILLSWSTLFAKDKSS